MARLVLALLAVAMLSLTAFVAYSTFSPTDTPLSDPPAATAAAQLQETPSCCGSLPPCCQQKASCCETQGDAGTCCQGEPTSEKSPAKK